MRAPFLALLPFVASALGCIVEEAPHLPPPMRPTPVVMRPPRPPNDFALVYVRGEFQLPGRYQLLAPARLTQVIDAAGGLTRIADPRVIVSRRLDDGRLVRFVVATDEVRAGLVEDPPMLPEDVIDAIGHY